MLVFSYKACLADDPCTITVREKDGGVYMIEKDNRFVLYILKKDGLWQAYENIPDDIYSDDISAVGDEIEKRLEEIKKAP